MLQQCYEFKIDVIPCETSGYLEFWQSLYNVMYITSTGINKVSVWGHIQRNVAISKKFG